ncbi:MAG: cyclic nucleotide-binding domain-containing protein [SAR324 cluster bacterium]|nr:cyclic nucleotide-binding domain-containing protein [SAR324 cluster bacterium]
MRLTIEKVLLLKSVAMLADTPDHILAELASILTEISVSSGETIVKEGEIGTSMYIIIDGKIGVYRNNKKLAILGNREVFGELAALSPEARTATIVAEEDTQLFRLDQEALHEFMGQYIEVAIGIINVLCQRLREQFQSK